MNKELKIVEKIALGKMIRKKRLKNDMTQKKIAEILGVTPSLVCLWEKGAKEPTATTYLNLQKIFKSIKHV